MVWILFAKVMFINPALLVVSDCPKHAQNPIFVPTPPGACGLPHSATSFPAIHRVFFLQNRSHTCFYLSLDFCLIIFRVGDGLITSAGYQACWSVRWSSSRWWNPNDRWSATRRMLLIYRRCWVTGRASRRAVRRQSLCVKFSLSLPSCCCVWPDQWGMQVYLAD